MKYKTIGVVFCFISAMLLCARYLSAAIFMSGVSSWDSALFEVGLEYVGTPLKTASVLALVVGIIFLAIGLFQDAYAFYMTKRKDK